MKRKKSICAIVTALAVVSAGCGAEKTVLGSADMANGEHVSQESEISREPENASGEQAVSESGEHAEDESGEHGSESAAGTETENSAAEAVPEEPEVITLKISAAGDVTLGNMHTQGYEGTFRQMYDQKTPEYFLENVKPIFAEDDMTIVNFEGVLTLSDERVEKTYNMKGDPEYVSILTAGSVEAVGLGNNHHMDYGQQGHDDTVAALEDAGIAYAVDGQIGHYEVKGLTVGFVSVNEVYDGKTVETWLENGIRQLREEGADLIIAACHWGIELDHYPKEYQKELGRKCIDWGADLVLGHHPHVLQGIEEYNGKYIVYSLGNFCFGGNRNPKNKDSMIFQQTFTFIDGEKQEDRDIQVIPCSISSVKSRNDYKPTPTEGKEAERIMGLLNKYSRDFGIEFDMEGHLIQEEFNTEDVG